MDSGRVVLSQVYQCLTPRRPVPPQCTAQAESFLSVILPQTPLQRRPHVLMFRFQLVQPLPLLRTHEFWLRLLRKH